MKRILIIPWITSLHRTVKCPKHKLVQFSTTSKSIVIGLFGIKEDRNSSRHLGAAKAPQIIRNKFFDSAVNTSSELGIDIVDNLKDFGDIHPKDCSHFEVLKSISMLMEDIYKTPDCYPLILGGDHSITFSTTTLVRKYLKKPFVIVHFDAHSDIYDTFDNNNNSHASSFARISEMGCDFCSQLISIGVRTINAAQMSQLTKYGVYTIQAKDFPSKGIYFPFLLLIYSC